MEKGWMMIDVVKNNSDDLMLVIRNDIRECHYCGKDFQKKGPCSKVCSRCKKVRYCNAVCQQSHWKLHRPFCKYKESPNGSGMMIDKVKNDSDLTPVVRDDVPGYYFPDDYPECCFPECDKRTGPYIKVCSGCKKVRYCSVDCQKSHWELHRPLCKLTT
jgi:hypothetical protein